MPEKKSLRDHSDKKRKKGVRWRGRGRGRQRREEKEIEEGEYGSGKKEKTYQGSCPGAFKTTRDVSVKNFFFHFSSPA